MTAAGDEKAAPSIREMLDEIFEKTINPQLRRAVELAEAAQDRAAVAEARVVALEQAILSDTALAKQFEDMARRVTAVLKPPIDRVLQVAEETFARNAQLSESRRPH